MFYQGSLQEAIQSAVQQAKLVVCFVTDDGAESIRWEAEFLTDQAIKDKLVEKSVALRLEAGSEEAGFLEALFPIPRKPTLVMIHNGQLKEYIAPGVAKDEFLRRAQGALDSATPNAAAQTQASTIAASESPEQTLPSSESVSTANQQQGVVSDVSRDTPAAQPAPSATSGSSSTPSAQERLAAQTQAILAERARRLEADKKAKEAKDKADREARAKARKSTDGAATDGNKNGSNDAEQKNIKPAERKHAQEVREQKIKDREHRQRILKRIEDDRRDRKERDAQERQARLLLNATADDSETAAANTNPIPLTTRLTESSSSGKGKTTAHCNLQVRLFDGSTIRARFPSDSKLEKDVREWVDEDRTDGDAPYTFRIVLTPLPNKAVSKAEESEETLESLGLSPSATLILVPVSYAAAYVANPRGDILGRALWPIVQLIGSGFRVIARILQSLVGGGGGGGVTGSAARAMGETTSATQAETPSSRIRDEDIELRERKKKGKKTAEGETNLYNGNSLSFEPRKDSDDEEED